MSPSYTEQKITLRAGGYSAQFLPEKGMNGVSLKKGEIEAIDQSTWDSFEERFSGLGPLIGPHFHHRKGEDIVPVKQETLFPHIARVKARGVQEPFSHGIARYAPWTLLFLTDEAVGAVLKGEDRWKGVPLKELEGQDFQFTFTANLSAAGLSIELSLESEKRSVAGLHTYYALAQGGGLIKANVQNVYNDAGRLKPIPSTWNYYDTQLIYDLKEGADWGFFPLDKRQATIQLETATHNLQVQYESPHEENSWQLWHPKGASFACIEPLSAKEPRKPRLTSSSLKILISIL